jgi:hypothetical protein
LLQARLGDLFLASFFVLGKRPRRVEQVRAVGDAPTSRVQAAVYFFFSEWIIAKHEAAKLVVETI